MARFIHCHPNLTRYDFHLFTDLDFWDARRLLKDLALVKRNFGDAPPGDEFPAQIVGNGVSRTVRREIEKRLTRAVVSPPRHVIVEAILSKEYFEFDPSLYYPSRWSRSRMLHFTYHRLPLGQGALNSPYNTVQLFWMGGRIRVERVRRSEKVDPPIRDRKEALRRLKVPACF